MKELISKGSIFIAIGLFLFLGFKSCIVTTISLDDYILLENTDKGGQRNRIIITPKEQMVIVKRFEDVSEMAVYDIEGEEATNYFGGLYCVGTFPLGLRYYSNAEKVLQSELSVIKKEGDSFPDSGSNFKAKMVIFKEKAKVGNHEYKRLKLSDNEKMELEEMINIFLNNGTNR